MAGICDRELSMYMEYLEIERNQAVNSNIKQKLQEREEEEKAKDKSVVHTELLQRKCSAFHFFAFLPAEEDWRETTIPMMHSVPHMMDAAPT